MNGWLGTGATPLADLNLLVQLAMAAALTVGMFLARAHRFRAHGWTQSSVLLLNLVAIGSVMVPSFHRQVMPHASSGWRDANHVVAMLHASLGTVAELLGLYVVLVAGTNVLPRALRFRNYKPWMRTTLALWWIVVTLGVGVYYVWYLLPPRGAAGGTPATPRPAGVTITVANFRFDPAEVSVGAGTTVEWVHTRGRHKIVADDGSFESPVLVSAARFSHMFAKPGVYHYYCAFHGGPGGKDMAGTVAVK